MSIEENDIPFEDQSLDGRGENIWISLKVHDFVEESETIFGKVYDMILKASNNWFQHHSAAFQGLIEEWLNHPIFRTVKSLEASIIFAKVFDKIRCIRTLQRISHKLKSVDTTLSGKTSSLAWLIALRFSTDVDWDNNISERVGELQNDIEQVERNDIEKKEIITQCSSLIDEVEICISQANQMYTVPPYTGRARILNIEQSNAVYKENIADYLEMKYFGDLRQLLEEGGDDASTAVTLFSEWFIGITYKIIHKYVVNPQKVDVQAKAGDDFILWYSVVDGDDVMNPEDVYLPQIKGILEKVENRDKFMEYWKQFVALRQMVHNHLMKVA